MRSGAPRLRLKPLQVLMAAPCRRWRRSTVRSATAGFTASLNVELREAQRRRCFNRQGNRRDCENSGDCRVRRFNRLHQHCGTGAGYSPVHPLDPDQPDAALRTTLPFGADHFARGFRQCASGRGPSRLCVRCARVAPHHRPQFQHRPGIRRRWESR
jgi:hypothetical protein